MRVTQLHAQPTARAIATADHDSAQLWECVSCGRPPALRIRAVTATSNSSDRAWGTAQLQPVLTAAVCATKSVAKVRWDSSARVSLTSTTEQSDAIPRGRCEDKHRPAGICALQRGLRPLRTTAATVHQCHLGNVIAYTSRGHQTVTLVKPFGPQRGCAQLQFLQRDERWIRVSTGPCSTSTQDTLEPQPMRHKPVNRRKHTAPTSTQRTRGKWNSSLFRMVSLLPRGWNVVPSPASKFTLSGRLLCRWCTTCSNSWAASLPKTGQ